MSTKSSIIIQDLTYTERTLGEGVTISYTNGGTNGSEVVSVVGSAITVQIGASTATNIKAAIDANEFSTKLVSCTVSGTGSNVQKSCKAAFLTGGAAVAKATLAIPPLLLTAHTNGGNSTTFKLVGDVAFTVTTVTDGTHLVISSSTLFVGDTIVQGANSTTITTVTDATHIIVGSTTSWTGSGAAASTSTVAGVEIVSVTSSAISCRIQDGVSTAAQVLAAIAANASAAALVDGATSSVSPTNPVFVASCATAANLTGGVASAVAATVINQDITITAGTAGVAGNLISLSYTTGATAGSEVVSVVGNAVNVQISNGVSTATQINTALAAATAFTAIATSTVSGTGATAQKTVNAIATAGAVGNGAVAFYSDGTAKALTSVYVAFPFGFMSMNGKLVNDDASGSNVIVFSFDGVNQHGSLAATKDISWQDMDVSCIWMKYTTAAPAYRLMVQGI